MIALVSSSASFAAADPAPVAPGLTEPVASDATPAADPTPLDLAIQRDAAGDRAFALGTASALPEGAFDVSVRGTVIAGVASVAAGIGHGVELSVTTGTTIDARDIMYGGGLKVELLRRARFAVAVDASVNRVAETRTFSVDRAGLFTAGAKATLCTDDVCSAVVTFGAGAVVENLDAMTRVDTAPFVNASVLAGTGFCRVLAEAGYLLDSRSGEGIGLGFGGVRLGGRTVAVDVGAAYAFFPAGAKGLPPIPLAGVSYRP